MGLKYDDLREFSYASPDSGELTSPLQFLRNEMMFKRYTTSLRAFDWLLKVLCRH